MAGAEYPDLIVTDVSMPEPDGLEMVRQLRAQPELEHVPILVLTALGAEEMDQLIRAGANRAISKPVLLDGLVDEVKELLAEAPR